MHQRSNFAASDATYHSFNDIELFEPPSPPRNTNTNTNNGSSKQPVNQEPPPSPVKMQRQDSGYESFAPSPRTSTSYSRRPSVSRRISTGSASGSSSGPGASPRPRARPAARRTATSKSYPHHQTKPQSLYLVRSSVHNMQHPHINYFHFPSPEPTSVPTADSEPSPASASAHDAPVSVPPPQTTHYWTSDNTRRMEYAAIDAASRGFKGWIRRRLVPDCFVSKESRHVSFDDDTGSVRRYRLELEDEPELEKTCNGGRFKRWSSWLVRKNTI